MSSWAERVHRRAADLSSVVTSCGHPGSSAPAYPYRLEKVKFGVPLEEVCKNNENIPGPLLVLILKLNKESPNRRDVFRAPGHQGAMKKLIHFLQAGRLVNVDNYSVYTIASVLKKFLRKIPNGIFGRSGEKELFAIIELDNEAEQTERLHRLFTSLPKYTQHLLVLLFGTFRVIASNAAPAATGMTSEALGVSVAPSFFQSCVSDGKTARMEDVLKFKVATKIMKHIIDKFATNDLFGRENYEYYARVTGRILKVQDEWICSFQYPPPPRGKLAQQKYALQHSLEAEKTWLQCQCERWGLLAQEESRSTPALLTSSSSAVDNSVLSLGVTPEHTFIESCARLSVSLEGPGLFAMTSSPLPKRNNSIRGDELLIQHRRSNQGGAEYDDDDDFTVGEGELDDDDEENYADDDDDDNDDDENEDDEHDENYNADDVHVDDIEKFDENHQQQLKFQTPKPKPTLSSKKKQMRKATIAAASGISANANLNVNVNDDDEDDDDAMTTAGKRRYRQNKKKTTTQVRTLHQQHTRRLRAGSKSLDGSERISGTKASSSSTATVQATATGTEYQRVDTMTPKLKSTKTLTTTVELSARQVASTNAPRTCSRCNRGIRHSSSCSSTSGGAVGGNGGNGVSANANGNNGGMTMEELRAVNRYAESTKSLSFLPQVHERQTARMITRSEWFLSGGELGDGMTLELPNACSNCCLLAAAAAAAENGRLNQQQQQQQQQRPHHFMHQQEQQRRDQHEKFMLQQHQQHKPFYYPHNYLGGGSTRDMRQHDNEYDDDDDDDYMNTLIRDGGNAFPLFYKQHRQQQYEQQIQQQQFSLQVNNALTTDAGASGGGGHCVDNSDMYMDTDDSMAIEQQQQYHQEPQHSPRYLHSINTKATYLSPTTGNGNLMRTFGGSGDACGSSNTHNMMDIGVIGGNHPQQHHMFLDTRTVGNIRLSNSAESVQCSTRRPTTARRLIGHSNIPRQYPLRASLRRNKEKQIGGGSGNGSNGGSNTNSNKNSTNNLNINNNNSTNKSNNNKSAAINNGINITDNKITFIDADLKLSGRLNRDNISSNQPPSVRNSIAECYGNILAPTFPRNRLEPKRAVSLKNYIDATENIVIPDVGDCIGIGKKVDDKNKLIYTTAQFGNITPPISLSTTSLITANIDRNSPLPRIVLPITTSATPSTSSSSAITAMTSPKITTTTTITFSSKQKQQKQSSPPIKTQLQSLALQGTDEVKTTSNTITYKAPRV